MDALIMECPVAGIVCEQAQPSLVALRVERRAANRAQEGWLQLGSNRKRMYHGHALKLVAIEFDGEIKGWFKWLDGHFKGVEYGGTGVAQLALETAADHSNFIGSRYQAWLDAGAPERRRVR